MANSEQPFLASNLEKLDFELRPVSVSAPESIESFDPDVIIVEFHEWPDNDTLTVVRHLRAKASTYSLPIVFAWTVDERTLRNAALTVGADDYFSITTPPIEIAARLDSLFWRIEAGRRFVARAGDNRIEIDNFMLLLDSVRTDMSQKAEGTVAVIYPWSSNRGPIERSHRDKILNDAHGFLKLHLRRIDSVAFYGPTSLLAYLPGLNPRDAVESATRLRRDFVRTGNNRDIQVGLASFPEDGRDVETLIERADGAVRRTTTIESISNRPTTETLVAPVEGVRTASDPLSETRQLHDDREMGRYLSPVIREKIIADHLDSVVSVGPSKEFKTDSPEDGRFATAAAAYERELRASGMPMPRRLLLAVSDAARMAQLNSLIRLAGYEARAAFDGQQALDLLRIERPDLLLLDYQLHGMDGLETLRRLQKQAAGRPALPVVILVPAGEPRVADEAEILGVRRIVRTPHDPADLLLKIREAGSSD